MNLRNVTKAILFRQKVILDQLRTERDEAISTSFQLCIDLILAACLLLAATLAQAASPDDVLSTRKPDAMIDPATQVRHNLARPRSS